MSKSALAPLECESSSIEGEVNEEFSEAATAHIDTFSASSCGLGTNSGCSLEAQNLPWTMRGYLNEEFSGFLYRPQLHMSCSYPSVGEFECTYQTEGETMGFGSGLAAEVAIQESPMYLLEGTKPWCGETAVLSATYVFDTPSPLYWAPAA